MNPLTSGGAQSADMYLDLSLKRAGKVKGESTSAGHASDIVVRGFSWGVGAAGDDDRGPVREGREAVDGELEQGAALPGEVQQELGSGAT